TPLPPPPPPPPLTADTTADTIAPPPLTLEDEKLLKDASPLRDLLTTTGSIFLVIGDGDESNGIFLVIGDWFDPNHKYKGSEELKKNRES
ncbi:hypothetical protein U1Q18_048350, partial [Sarracenia purpurea var. burkii]